MSFIDWMNMSMLVDISFLVFASVFVWKFTKIQNRINKLESDLNLVTRNPQAAKRRLKNKD